jgi:hypothetical protein
MRWRARREARLGAGGRERRLDVGVGDGLAVEAAALDEGGDDVAHDGEAFRGHAVQNPQKSVVPAHARYIGRIRTTLM